jgi:hypothetical protein
MMLENKRQKMGLKRKATEKENKSKYTKGTKRKPKKNSDK